MNAEEFNQELSALEKRFEDLKPELEITVRDPELGVEGYVVVWTTLAAINGPLGRCGKGGTRITPNTNLDEIKMLARIMALKNAAAGLPLGGAKSGMRDDPASPGFEKRYRRFVQLVAPLLIERGGIFGGFGFDIGGRPEHAIWACDELKSTRCFTGKPVELGGTDYDREGIAGLGVCEGAIAALTSQGREPNGATFAVQGLGAMGGAVVRYFGAAGGVLKAVSDPRVGGCYFIENGASAQLIAAIAQHDWTLTNTLLKTEGRRADSEAIFFYNVDILFPCAVQDVITIDNSANIRAKIVVEGANNPCSAAARTALHHRGVLVIPDFIVNAGGIIAAFVEMSSSISPEENARTRANVLEAKRVTIARLGQNVRAALELATRVSVEPTLAARLIGLRNLLGGSGGCF